MSKSLNRTLADEENVDDIRFWETTDLDIEDICTNYKHIQILGTIHESLNWLLEHGRIYSEQDYLHLLQLQYKSFVKHDRENFDLQKYKQLVKQALNPNTKKNSA